MQRDLRCSHSCKDVFLLRQARKKVKAKTNALRTELLKKWKVDKETNAGTLTLSKVRREMNAWQDFISHEIDVSMVSDADLNFPKIHIMSDWVEQIRWHGALQLYSAERHDQAHKTNLKDRWNAFNHNLNYLPQVITFQRCILCFEVRELNLEALPQHQEYSATACKVLPASANLAAPLSPESYAKPEFVGPQNHRDGMHPDGMIKVFRALLDNTQDAMHHVAIYSGLREFIKHKSRNKTYISDEQTHAMDLCIHHGIKVQLEGLDGERISVIGRCTGSQSWCRGDQWNNLVSETQCPGRCYGAPNGLLPCQLQRLFKIKLLNKDGAFVEYWLTLALTSIPEYFGDLDPV